MQPTSLANKRQPTTPANKRQPTNPAKERQHTSHILWQPAPVERESKEWKHKKITQKPNTPRNTPQRITNHLPNPNGKPTTHQRITTTPTPYWKQPTYPDNRRQPTPPANKMQPTSPANKRQPTTPANKRQPTNPANERQHTSHILWQPAPVERESKEWKHKKITQKPNTPKNTPQRRTNHPLNPNGRPTTHQSETTIATINVIGMKGKIKSLETTLNMQKISLALITKTQLKKKKKISVKGYSWVHKPRPNNNGVGMGILEAEEILQNTTEDNSGEDHDWLETKWIKLECRPKNIAIGVLYGPQEN